MSPDGHTVQFATGLKAGDAASTLYDVSSISDGDLSRVIPVAILIIGVLLALVMRSLVDPLYLIASVGLSYLAALAAASSSTWPSGCPWAS